MNVPQVQGTGLTRRKLKGPSIRGSKFSSTKGSNNGRPAKLVSYCPVCVYPPADPERAPHASVGPTTKTGRCPANHTWSVGGASHTSDVSIVHS